MTGIVSPGESVCLCGCVIMAQCGPEDIYCSKNYRRSGFKYFARCIHVCLSVQLSVDPFSNAIVSQHAILSIVISRLSCPLPFES